MANIAVLSTGGTIASRVQGEQGALAQSGVDLVNTASTSHTLIHREVFALGSYQLTLADIRRVAWAISETVADPQIEGIVITHGTDTLEETAFLTDLVRESPKPVVFTGAQETADSSSPDGPGNLSEAIQVAADPRMRGMGTLISFAHTVRTARGARKTHTLAAAAFCGGVEVGHFAKGDLMLKGVSRPRPSLPRPSVMFDEVVVDIVNIYPGAEATLLSSALKRSHAVVIAGSGVGNAGAGFTDVIAKTTKPIILASRVPWGPVVPIYGNGGGVDLVKAGAIPSGDLNPYQARILTALLLSLGYADKEFTEKFIEYR